jgi:hypothetical protein
MRYRYADWMSKIPVRSLNEWDTGTQFGWVRYRYAVWMSNTFYCEVRVRQSGAGITCRGHPTGSSWSTWLSRIKKRKQGPECHENNWNKFCGVRLPWRPNSEPFLLAGSADAGDNRQRHESHRNWITRDRFGGYAVLYKVVSNSL